MHVQTPRMFGGEPRHVERASWMPARRDHAIAALKQLARHLEAKAAVGSADECLQHAGSKCPELSIQRRVYCGS